jgi:hypothetical protein
MTTRADTLFFGLVKWLAVAALVLLALGWLWGWLP